MIFPIPVNSSIATVSVETVSVETVSIETVSIEILVRFVFIIEC